MKVYTYLINHSHISVLVSDGDIRCWVEVKGDQNGIITANWAEWPYDPSNEQDMKIFEYQNAAGNREAMGKMAIDYLMDELGEENLINYCKDTTNSMADLLKEAITVQENMQRHGGSFIKKIGAAIVFADTINLAKIRNTWSMEWEQYLNWDK